MPHFNRMDVCEAWYLYLSTHYYGQGDPLYKRLCKLQTYFHVGGRGIDYSTLNENGKAIYDELVLNKPTG